MITKRLSISARALLIIMIVSLLYTLLISTIFEGTLPYVLPSFVPDFLQDLINDGIIYLFPIWLIIGFSLNYYGWKLHHIYVSLMGFLVLGAFGAIIGISEPAKAIMLFLLFGIVGWFIAPLVEKAFVYISGFLIGTIASFIIIDTSARLYFVELAKFLDTCNVCLAIPPLIGIGFAWIFWKMYRFFMTLILSLIGSFMTTSGINFVILLIGIMTPLDLHFIFVFITENFIILYIIILLSGVYTQYKKKPSSIETIEKKQTEAGEIKSPSEIEAIKIQAQKIEAPKEIKGFNRRESLYLISGVLLSILFLFLIPTLLGIGPSLSISFAIIIIFLAYLYSKNKRKS